MEDKVISVASQWMSKTLGVRSEETEDRINADVSLAMLGAAALLQVVDEAVERPAHLPDFFLRLVKVTHIA